MQHQLKILPCYFEAVESGDKTFEIRDDRGRGFQKGDTVILKEYLEPTAISDGVYTGNEIEKIISYVTAFEQKPGYVVFGIRDV